MKSLAFKAVVLSPCWVPHPFLCMVCPAHCKKGPMFSGASVCQNQPKTLCRFMQPSNQSVTPRCYLAPFSSAYDRICRGESDIQAIWGSSHLKNQWQVMKQGILFQDLCLEPECPWLVLCKQWLLSFFFLFNALFFLHGTRIWNMLVSDYSGEHLGPFTGVPPITGILFQNT